MKTTRQRRRYTIAILVGAVMALAVLLARGTFTQTEGRTILKDVSDAFFVPGVLIICLGALLFVGENGIFDMLNFGVKKVVSLVRNEKYRAELPRTYYEYTEQQREKTRSAYGYLFIVGAVFLLAAVIFVILHETA